MARLVGWVLRRAPRSVGGPLATALCMNLSRFMIVMRDKA